MDRENWDERYETGDYTPREYPSGLLRNFLDWAPDGRAIEVATGTGRNALFLAERGYEVDALDISETALSIAKREATKRSLDVNWIRADAGAYDFPREAYDVAIVSFYHDPSLVQKLVAALAPGGVLMYEHHVRTSEDVERGPDDERRFRSNDLLRYCLGMTVLEYRETVRTFDSGERSGTTGAVASIVARKTDRGKRAHPPEP